MDLNEIRKYFYESNDYVIRIRKNKKDEIQDIVYYHGIKLFTITKTLIKLSVDIFNINDDLVKANKDKGAAVKELKAIREKVKGLLSVKNDAKIVFKKSPSSSYSEEDVKDTIDGVKNLIKYNKKLNYDEENTILRLQDFELDELPEIEYDIFNHFVYEYHKKGWVKPAFNLFEAKIKLNKLYINNSRLVLGKNGDAEITDEAVREAVKMYEAYAYEAEKNYQHLFMIDKRIESKTDEFNGIFRFEEEYYIADNTSSGRIDNVFIKYNNDKTADLYLIELKYGNKVLAGKDKHGIIDHLKDIEDLMSDKEKISRSDFMDTLIARVDYRTEQINKISNKKYEKIKSFRNVYFWIVIGYSNDKDDIKEVLGELKSGIKSRVENLKKYDCNIKIFLDKTEFSESDKIRLTDAKFEPWSYD